MTTEQQYITDEKLTELLKACEHKFLVDLGGEVRLGRGELQSLIHEVQGLRAFKRSVDYALNSGDGSYRP